MENFQIINGGRELLDLVQPLWEKLNKHHENNSSYFSEKFRNLKFEVRKNKFINDETLNVKIDLIKDKEKDVFIGYCISSINKDLIAEIESLFVETDYRKYGLGCKLMDRSLDWMKSNKVKIKIIGVAEGNEDVLNFYKKYGFYKKAVILEHINEECMD